MNRSTIIVGALLISIILIACAPKAAPPPSSGIEKEMPLTGEKPIRESWEQKWKDTLQAAKKEGKVVVFIGIGGELRAAVVKAFREKYGIEVDAISFRGDEFATRIKAERRAGLYSFDVYQSGITTAVLTLKPEGILDPLEPALILPEVTDPKAWWKGEIHFVDKERLALNFAAYPSAPIAINTDIVKTEEMRSYNDLLNPRWKGKISMNDPTLPGAGGNLVGVVGDHIMGYDFLRKLAQQEPLIMRDRRLQIDWLAAGKYPIAIGPDTMPLVDFQNLGFPLKEITPLEGTHVTAGYGTLALINRAPHPNAARVYINWLLTREAQLLYSKIVQVQSGRVDIPTDFLPPSRIRDPKVKYVDQASEEYTRKHPEYFKIAREIFGHLIK